jgi:sugar lactone lactonase YvrE
VARDGTIYATQTGTPDGQTPMRVYRISSTGTASIFADGGPLSLPNGVGIDGDGNIVVLNMGDSRVLTFSPAGKLLKTEHAAQAGSDGLVILPDGTKYVSSVRQGGISRIRPGKPAELIATGIPNAASMCFDARANQLVIPMNPNNAVAFVRLGRGRCPPAAISSSRRACSIKPLCGLFSMPHSILREPRRRRTGQR